MKKSTKIAMVVSTSTLTLGSIAAGGAILLNNKNSNNAETSTILSNQNNSNYEIKEAREFEELIPQFSSKAKDTLAKDVTTKNIRSLILNLPEGEIVSITPIKNNSKTKSTKFGAIKVEMSFNKNFENQRRTEFASNVFEGFKEESNIVDDSNEGNGSQWVDGVLPELGTPGIPSHPEEDNSIPLIPIEKPSIPATPIEKPSIPSKPLEPSKPIDHNKEVRDAVSKLQLTTLNISQKGRGLFVDEVDSSNINECFTNWPQNTNTVKYELVNKYTTEENDSLMTMNIKVSSGKVSQTVTKSQKGFMSRNSLVDYQINKVEELNKMTIKESSKNVNIKDINVENFESHVNNFPKSTDKVTIKLNSLERSGDDSLKASFEFKSGWLFKEKAFEVKGFAYNQNEVYKEITNQTATGVAGQKGINEAINKNTYEQNGLERSYNLLEQYLSKNNSPIDVYFVMSDENNLSNHSMIAEFIKVNELAKSNENLSVKLFISEKLSNKFDFKSHENNNRKLSTIVTNNPMLELSKVVDEDHKNVLFIDESESVNKMQNINKISNNEIVNHLSLLAFDNINIIGSGISSARNFSDDIYSFYKNNPYLQYDATSKTYKNASQLVDEIKTNIANGFTAKVSQWINKEQNNMKTLFAAILSDSTTTKYLLASDKVAKDANNSTSTNLSINDLNDEYFVPYNIENANLIEFIKDVDQEAYSSIVKSSSNIKTLKGGLKDYSKNFVIELDTLQTNGQIDSTIEKISRFITNSNESDYKVWIKTTSNISSSLESKLNNSFKSSVSMEIISTNLSMEYLYANGLFENTTLITGFSDFSIELSNINITTLDVNQIDYKLIIDDGIIGNGGDAASLFGTKIEVNGISPKDVKDYKSLSFPISKLFR